MDDNIPEPSVTYTEAIQNFPWEEHHPYLQQAVYELDEVINLAKWLLVSYRLKNIDASSIIAFAALIYSTADRMKKEAE